MVGFGLILQSLGLFPLWTTAEEEVPLMHELEGCGHWA